MAQSLAGGCARQAGTHVSFYTRHSAAVEQCLVGNTGRGGAHVLLRPSSGERVHRLALEPALEMAPRQDFHPIMFHIFSERLGSSVTRGTWIVRGGSLGSLSAHFSLVFVAGS